MCGLKRNIEASNYRICSKHGYRDKVVYVKIPFGGKQNDRKITVKVPCPVGTESTLCIGSTPSKGMGGDRLVKKILDDVNDRMVEGSKSRDSASWAMELQLLSENIDKSPYYNADGTGERRITINESVANTIGLEAREFDTTPTKTNSSFFQTLIEKESKMKKSGDMLPPRVKPGCIDDKEIKRRTNFSDESSLLLLIFVVCNGDVDVVTSVTSAMTWYEEWSLCLDFCGVKL